MCFHRFATLRRGLRVDGGGVVLVRTGSGGGPPSTCKVAILRRIPEAVNVSSRPSHPPCDAPLDRAIGEVDVSGVSKGNAAALRWIAVPAQPPVSAISVRFEKVNWQDGQ